MRYFYLFSKILNVQLLLDRATFTLQREVFIKVVLKPELYKVQKKFNWTDFQLKFKVSV